MCHPPSHRVVGRVAHVKSFDPATPQNLERALGQNPYRSIVSLKFDDVTMTLSLIVLSLFFLQTHLDTILLHIKIC